LKKIDVRDSKYLLHGVPSEKVIGPETAHACEVCASARSEAKCAADRGRLKRARHFIGSVQSPSRRRDTTSIDRIRAGPQRRKTRLLGFVQNLNSRDSRVIHDWFKGEIQLPQRTWFYVMKGLGELV